MLADDFPAFVAFAIDPGAVSGWAILLGPDEAVDHGVAKRVSDLFAACEVVKEVSEDVNLPIVVVAEGWTAGGWQNYLAMIGVGKAFGRWLPPVELVLGIREDRILRVTPQKWRNHLFTSAEIKAAQKDKKHGGLKRLSCTYARVQDDNEADAFCMGVFAQSSVEGMDAGDLAVKRWAKAGLAGKLSVESGP